MGCSGSTDVQGGAHPMTGTMPKKRIDPEKDLKLEDDVKHTLAMLEKEEKKKLETEAKQDLKNENHTVALLRAKINYMSKYSTEKVVPDMESPSMLF